MKMPNGMWVCSTCWTESGVPWCLKCDKQIDDTPISGTESLAKQVGGGQRVKEALDEIFEKMKEEKEEKK